MAVQYSGGTYINTTFTGDSRRAIMQNIATQLVAAGWISRPISSGQGPGNSSAAVTITIASPGVVTMAAHGFLGGERVILQTTGALPTGLSTNTIYFVKFIDANTFNLATSLGGANINTSGTQSGTHSLNTESYLMETVTQTAVTNPIRVRIKDLLATSVAFGIENTLGTLSTGVSTGGPGLFLFPQPSQIMRIIATKYWFMCFVPGTTSPRSFVHGGMPYIDPTLFSGVTDIGFMFGNSFSDGDTSNRTSLRNCCAVASPLISTPGYSCIYNNNILTSYYNSQSWQAPPEIVITSLIWGAASGNARSYRWPNGALLTSDVLISWGLTNVTDEAFMRGQFYDMIYIAEVVPMDTTDTFGGHNWYNITNNNSPSSSNNRGGVWVATS